MLIALSITLIFLFHQCEAKQYKFIAMGQRRAPRCEKVKSHICLNEVSQGYNSTMFPNYFNHTKQEEAIDALTDFKPLLEYGCSKYLATFLCSVYLPICTPGLRKPIKPCRSLCQKVADGCSGVVKKYGYEWSSWFNCKDFPKEGGRELCIDTTSYIGNKVEPTKTKGKKGKRKSRRVSGRENENLTLKCGNKRKIYIKKVIHSRDSSCCRSASKAVLSAMCNGKAECRFTASPSSLGGHCNVGSIGKISVRYKCSKNIIKSCPE